MLNSCQLLSELWPVGRPAYDAVAYGQGFS